MDSYRLSPNTGRVPLSEIACLSCGARYQVPTTEEAISENEPDQAIFAMRGSKEAEIHGRVCVGTPWHCRSCESNFCPVCRNVLPKTMAEDEWSQQTRTRNTIWIVAGVILFLYVIIERAQP